MKIISKTYLWVIVMSIYFSSNACGMDICLLDVQGLYGGRNIWITSDGQITFQKVSIPEKNSDQQHLIEKIYTWQLNSDEIANLNTIIANANLKNLEIPKRLGIPDEAHPIIFVRENDNEYHVMKWANDMNERFDSVYMHLMKLSSTHKNIKEKTSGKYRGESPPTNVKFPNNNELIEKQ